MFAAAVSFYDPILTAGGATVLERLGVTVTRENENCRRRVSVPREAPVRARRSAEA